LKQRGQVGRVVPRAFLASGEQLERAESSLTAASGYLSYPDACADHQ
jgi:hypothetical protein